MTAMTNEKTDTTNAQPLGATINAAYWLGVLTGLVAAAVLVAVVL